jgi:fibronectin-binding autotransporter adhesin
MITDPGMKGGDAARSTACFVLAAAIIVSLPAGARAVTYTWLGGGNWGDPAKWNPSGFPNAAGDVAKMDQSSSALLADVNTNDASFTVASISTSKGSNNLTISNVPDGTGGLIFDNNGANASIYSVKNSGKYCRINVPVILNDNLVVKSMVTSATLTFGKGISSGAGRTTGIIIESQSGMDSAQNPADVKLTVAAGYTGETRIKGSAVTGTAGATNGGGKLVLGLDNALPVTTVLRIDGATTTYYPKGGMLKLDGKNQEVAGLYGEAGYNPGQITTTTAATLTINNAADYDFAGNIGGGTPTPISVVKKGLGVQTLRGTNTYTGDTTVETGTLALAETGELRFAIRNGNVANRIGGAGTVALNGLLRLDTGALTDTTGTWNLVKVATLTASFGPSFNLAFDGGPVFSNRGGGVYTCTNGWVFTTASGNLSLTPGTAIIVR